MIRQVGKTVLFFGIGTIVLNLVGYEFVILMWLDSWGHEVGWVLRSAMVVLGMVLMFVGGLMTGNCGHEDDEEEYV